MLPIKNFQKLRFGWGVQEQANFAVVYQLSELVKPLLVGFNVKKEDSSIENEDSSTE